jgi:hypothetical protein
MDRFPLSYGFSEVSTYYINIPTADNTESSEEVYRRLEYLERYF